MASALIQPLQKTTELKFINLVMLKDEDTVKTSSATSVTTGATGTNMAKTAELTAGGMMVKESISSISFESSPGKRHFACKLYRQHSKESCQHFRWCTHTQTAEKTSTHGTTAMIVTRPFAFQVLEAGKIASLNMSRNMTSGYNGGIPGKCNNT